MVDREKNEDQSVVLGHEEVVGDGGDVVVVLVEESEDLLGVVGGAHVPQVQSLDLDLRGQVVEASVLLQRVEVFFSGLVERGGVLHCLDWLAFLGHYEELLEQRWLLFGLLRHHRAPEAVAEAGFTHALAHAQ